MFQVNKTDDFANKYPATIVDKTAGIRNWVWQIALDKDERPVVAYPHIDNAKTTHVYWYARWNGADWKNTWVQYGGHAFHHNWNSTELCYSGGMAIDPDNINDLYLSIPTKDGRYNKDGVYELWRYTIGDAYTDYHAKGFEVVGVSLDNNKAAWLKAIGQLNMPWPQMSDLKGWQSEGAKLYNVKAIPANVLVDQQGKIIAKDLRGEDLLQKMAELLK